MELKNQTTLFIIFLFFSAALMFPGSVVGQKVYRWVDENGEVHYSETLPPDFEDKEHDELDQQGIVRARDQSLVPPPPKPKVEEVEEELPDPDELPRDSSGMKRPERLYSERETKRRLDNLLLLRYDSEQEIEEAKTVEISQLEYDRLLVKASRESMSESYRGQIREAAMRQRSGVKVDQEIIQSITRLQGQLQNSQQSLNRLQARQDKIVANFETELERYRELKRNQP
jgi:hypothetical protein